MKSGSTAVAKLNHVRKQPVLNGADNMEIFSPARNRFFPGMSLRSLVGHHNCEKKTWRKPHPAILPALV